MQELQTAVATGTDVLVRGHHWSVIRTRPFARCSLVTLEGRDAANAGARLTVVTPADRLTAPSPHRLRRRRRHALLRATLDTIARARPDAGLWSGVSGSFHLHPWQLAPALAVVDGATRVLLADGVGLGKTVQAGLVLAELQQRGLVERALILTPPALREPWRHELADRFGIAATIVDQAALATLARDAASGANPWASAAVVVSSIDLVKRPEVRAAVESEPLDLLIVDEAHHVTPGTDRGVLVSRLASQTPWLVLASATPHDGDEAAFRWLLALGETGPDDEPMRVFRRSRTEAGLRLPRRTCRLLVRPSLEEEALQTAVLAYARDVSAGAPDGAALHLLAAVLARRAASTASAAERTLTRRLAALSSSDGPADVFPEAAQAPLPWEEHDEADLSPVPGLGRPGLPRADVERERLESLIALARRAAACPSKLLRLQRLVRRLAEPMVVFTEFRDSLDACRDWLEAVTSVACLHGGMDVPARAAALRRFLDGDARVLLATDVAGEGLNFQARARLVVTLEWPWNPQRLEQRIGRVDRLGQARRVHAIHLTGLDTVEQSVVARLMARAHRAEHDLSTSAPTEAIVGAAVLGHDADEPLSLDGHPRMPQRPAPGRAEPEAARLAAARSIAARGVARGDGWAVPRVGHPPTDVAVVCDATTLGPSGRLLARVPVAVRVTLASTPPHRQAWVRLVRRLARDPRVHALAISAAPPVDPARWSTARTRLEAIRSGLAVTRPRMVQPSLFDARAHREMARLDAARHRLEARLTRHLAWLAAGSGSVDVRVTTVLPVPAEPAR